MQYIAYCQAKSCPMKMIHENLLYDQAMAGRPLLRKPTENAARLRAMRMAAGISQAGLARQLGIPSRTLCFYEVDADHIPSKLVPSLAQALGVSVEQVLGINESSSSKRGPKSHWERQLDVVSRLPRHQQKKIIDVVNALVAQHNGGRMQPV